MLPKSIERTVLWEDSGVIVSFVPARFKRHYARKGDDVPNSFVRLYQPDITKISELRLYLHSPMGVNALKRCLHARQEVCSTLQIVKNIYTGNCTRLSIDFFAADTSLLPTHRVRFGTRDDFEGEACGRDTLLGFGNSLLMHLQKL